jgi:site-specific DNA recombinase
MAKTLRCAIYTRKSSEEGLDQDFNSLHAQREACEAFIKSQKHEGWQLIKTAYDDGGISGGTMNRPALQQLLTDIKARRVDAVVVYKADRLTRSLADFAKMVEVFDAHSVSFVSVTQQFNTTTSMGRLTLNVLLSFAQFEREVTGERIRDKIAASKKKGIWMGGPVPIGYEVKERKLLVIPKDAETVRHIFRCYLESGCVRLLQKNITESGVRSLKGYILSRGTLYKMLSNPIYIGQTRHKGICHTGQHEGIIDQELWNQVQQRLSENRIGTKTHPRKTERSPLIGKLFDASGERLVPVHANKKGRRYRYYISRSLLNNPKNNAMSGWRLPAQEIEQVVTKAALSLLQDREAMANTMHEAEVAVEHMSAALQTEIASDVILEKYIERVELNPDGMCLTLSLAPLVPNKNVHIRREIPMKMKRRGVEMRMVIGNDAPVRIDMTLVQTIAKARQWAQEFLSGSVPTMATIALREGIDKGSLSRIINLAFLAPSIVEAIAAGMQPADLTTQKLLRQTVLPLDWSEQKRLLGFVQA